MVLHLYALILYGCRLILGLGAGDEIALHALDRLPGQEPSLDQLPGMVANLVLQAGQLGRYPQRLRTQ